MTKYIIIALILHSFFFININRNQTLGDPNFSIRRNIAISYNVINKDERADNMRMEQAFQEEVESEPEKEIEKKVEKEPEPEIKSKMSKEKKEEEKKEKPKEEPKKEKNKNKKDNKKKHEKKEITEKKPNPDDVFTKSGNFTANADGTYTAISSKGIDFKIITQIDPAYPRQAEAIRYNKTVSVEARFLVDLNGNVEDIKILKSHSKLGFDREVIAALKRWKFRPIQYNGRRIKVYFNKEFIFTPKV